MNIILDIDRKKQCHFLFFVMAMAFCFLIVTPANAYIEETDDGRTKLTAGEINTNFNRMSNQGIISLKKLKQIDEMMAKSPDAGDGSAQNVAEVSQLVAEKEDAQIRAESKQAREAAKLLANKADLQNKNQQATIQIINELAVLNVRDEQAAAELLRQFSGRQL